MRTPRALLLVGGALVASAIVPAPATAALAWAPCAPAGFECAELPVPVDRAGSVPGTIGLDVTRAVAATNPTRTAVVGLAGGPGQAAIPLATGFARRLAPALATRDLLILDQRGTGGSNPLACGALNLTAAPSTVVAERCALQLGPARAFFRTPDTVADLEALRIEGGYDKLALFGVSYGTKVALAYAAAHPDRVESLVLDSVVPPEGLDAFRRPSLRAIGRVLSELCAAGRCRGITTGASRDVRAVAARLRRKALRGSVYSASGRRFTARVSEAGLYAILLAGDLNPALRAELPGSLRSALTGDARPLLRLSARSAGLQNQLYGTQSSAADSTALFLTTTCEENPTLPWTRGAPLRTRRDQAVAALRALPSRDLGPFSRAAVAALSYAEICLGWPTASPAPDVSAPLPAVPTLVLDGRADLRTPIEDAASVAARIPGAQVVGVPDVGHSVTGADPTPCTAEAIAAFYGGRPVAQCAPAAPRFSPTPKPPARLGALRPYTGLTGTVGRTVEALRLSVNDAQRQLIGAALALGATPAGAGGLRGGSVRVTASGLTLRSYELVPGVRISGVLPERGNARLRVTGRSAARGTVTVTPALQVSGTLGGRRVRTTFGTRSTGAARAARPFGGLTLARAARLGRRVRGG